MDLHQGPIQAIAHDPASDTVASGDESGLVAIRRRGEQHAGLVLKPGGPIHGALALSRGGGLIAIGDMHGTIGVYRTDTGRPTFVESRGEHAGKVRGMLGATFSPDASTLATISRDGAVRVWDLVSQERLASWRGFSGQTVDIGTRGIRVLVLDAHGQPRLLNLAKKEDTQLQPAPMACTHARFVLAESAILCLGADGLALINVADGQCLASFLVQGGAGLLGMVLSHDKTEAAILTERGLHRVSLPSLKVTRTREHGVEEPTGQALWTSSGIRIAGADGKLHGAEGSTHVASIKELAIFGRFRVISHDNRVAIWDGSRRTHYLRFSSAPRRMALDREARFLAMLPQDGPLAVYRLGHQDPLLVGDDQSSRATSVAIGGSVVCTRTPGGGMQWWNLDTAARQQMDNVNAMAMTAGGTWIACVDAEGRIRLLHPTTGQDVLPCPEMPSDSAVRKLAFINRRPELLVLDHEGRLFHFDLGQAVRLTQTPKARLVRRLESHANALWGITGGRMVLLRTPSGDRANVLAIEIATGEVIKELKGLHFRTTADPETGHLLEPGRSAGLLERDLEGRQLRVLRSLSSTEWLSFGPRKIEECSSGASSLVPGGFGSVLDAGDPVL